MKWSKKDFLTSLAEVAQIAIAFLAADHTAEKLLRSSRWWVKLLVYVAVCGAFQGARWLIKRARKEKSKDADGKE